MREIMNNAVMLFFYNNASLACDIRSVCYLPRYESKLIEKSLKKYEVSLGKISSSTKTLKSLSDRIATGIFEKNKFEAPWGRSELGLPQKLLY